MQANVQDEFSVGELIERRFLQLLALNTPRLPPGAAEPLCRCTERDRQRGDQRPADSQDGRLPGYEARVAECIADHWVHPLPCQGAVCLFYRTNDRIDVTADRRLSIACRECQRARHILHRLKAGLNLYKSGAGTTSCVASRSTQGITSAVPTVWDCGPKWPGSARLRIVGSLPPAPPSAVGSELGHYSLAFGTTGRLEYAWRMSGGVADLPVPEPLSPSFTHSRLYPSQHI